MSRGPWYRSIMENKSVTAAAKQAVGGELFGWWGRSGMGEMGEMGVWWTRVGGSWGNDLYCIELLYTWVITLICLELVPSIRTCCTVYGVHEEKKMDSSGSGISENL